MAGSAGTLRAVSFGDRLAALTVPVCTQGSALIHMLLGSWQAPSQSKLVEGAAIKAPGAECLFILMAVLCSLRVL